MSAKKKAKAKKTKKTTARKKPLAKKLASKKKKTAAKKPATKRAPSSASNASHPVFGALNPGDEIAWQKTLTLGKHATSVELNVDAGTKPSAKTLDALAPFVTRLASFDAEGRASLRRSYDDEGADSTVGMYLDHHLEELSSDQIASIFGGKAKEAVDVEALISAVSLSRVGLYVEETGGRAVFDYTISKDATQYLLVVGFNEKGKVTSIDMES